MFQKKGNAMQKQYYKGIVLYLFDNFILIDNKEIMLTDISLIEDFAQSNHLSIRAGKCLYTIKGSEINMYNFIKDLSFQVDVICR